ncbi:hypothetical protein HK405_003649 [Cladochytrium tenue]|nr:hypothetical protein HK405_003649 [Cladochytrium tenue]
MASSPSPSLAALAVAATPSSLAAAAAAATNFTTTAITITNFTTTTTSTLPLVVGEASGGGQMAALWLSFAVVAASEFGDKTFLVSAVLAARGHSRVAVFTAAMAALVLLAAPAALLGRALPAVLSPRALQWAAAVLLLGFAAAMAREALRAPLGPDETAKAEAGDKNEDRLVDGAGRQADSAAATAAGGRDRFEEVQRSIPVVNSTEAAWAAIRRHSRDLGGDRGDDDVDLNCADSSPVDIEDGQEAEETNDGERLNGRGSLRPRLRSLYPVLVQAFVLTFLAEWGDRSQIATVVLAGAHDPVAVVIGSLLGHALCLLIAVVAGKALARHLSERAITAGGSALLFVFGVIAVAELLAQPPSYSSSSSH